MEVCAVMQVAHVSTLNLFAYKSLTSVLLFLLLLYVLPREGTAGQAHFVAASNGVEREDEPWSR